MSDLAEQLGVGAGYRLGVPNYHTYQPSTLEQVYAQGMAHKLSPDHMLGFMVGAQADRQLQGMQYSEDLAQANRAQSVLNEKRLANDAYKLDVDLTKAALANPHQASAFAPSYRLIRPEAQQHMENMAGAGLELTRADAYQKRGAGTESYSDSGVAPPAGTQYDALGRPQAPMSQGVRPDIQKEQIGAAARVASASAGGSAPGGMKDQHLIALGRLQYDIQNSVNNAYQQAYRAQLAKTGVIEDPTGRLVVPPGIKAEGAIANAEAAGNRAAQTARQAYAGVEHTLGAGGRGRFLAPNPIPNAPASGTPAPDTGAPRLNPPPAGTPGPNVGQPTPPPATAQTGQQRAATAPQNQAAAGASTGAELDAGLRTRLARTGASTQKMAEVQRMVQQHKAQYDVQDINGVPHALIGDQQRGVIARVPLR